MDSQQANYVGSFAFFEAYAGRYVEHGVGRNWKCGLGVYCSKPDKEYTMIVCN